MTQDHYFNRRALCWSHCPGSSLSCVAPQAVGGGPGVRRGQEGSGGVWGLLGSEPPHCWAGQVVLSLCLPRGHSGLSPGCSLPSRGSSFAFLSFAFSSLFSLFFCLHGFYGVYRLCPALVASQAGPLGTVSVRLVPSRVFTPMQPFRLLILLGFQFSGGSRVLDIRVLEQQSDGLASSKTETRASIA